MKNFHLVVVLALLTTPVSCVGHPAGDRLPDLVEHATPSLVDVQAVDASTGAVATGSGFLVGRRRIITAAHVVEGASEADVFTSAFSDPIQAQVIGIDPDADLALLELTGEESPGPHLVLATEEPKVGSSVVVIGSPGGLTGTVTSGILSARRAKSGVETLQLSCPTAPGASGSPVLNEAGGVIGVITGYRSDVDRVAFASPASRVAALMQNPTMPPPEPSGPASAVGQRPPAVKILAPSIEEYPLTSRVLRPGAGSQRTPPREILQQIASALILVEGQSQSLDGITSKYPELREKVMTARSEFRRAFGAAVVSADAYLLERTSSEETSWSDRKQEVVERALTALDFSQVSQKEARDYIKTVQQRTLGDMPEGVYRALVFFHPRYAKHPHLELVDDYETKYESKGNPKALGMNVMLIVPRSWSPEDGDRPHVVQKFESPDETASVMLIIRDANSELTADSDEELLRYLSSQEYLESESPGATWLASGTTTLAGKPASYCDFIMERDTMMGGLSLRARLFYLLFRGDLIILACDVAFSGEGATSRAKQEFARYEASFNLIAGGVDVLNKYE